MTDSPSALEEKLPLAPSATKPSKQIHNSRQLAKFCSEGPVGSTGPHHNTGSEANGSNCCLSSGSDPPRTSISQCQKWDQVGPTGLPRTSQQSFVVLVRFLSPSVLL